jgi:hypothetical protein
MKIPKIVGIMIIVGLCLTLVLLFMFVDPIKEKLGIDTVGSLREEKQNLELVAETAINVNKHNAKVIKNKEAISELSLKTTKDLNKDSKRKENRVDAMRHERDKSMSEGDDTIKARSNIDHIWNVYQSFHKETKSAD